ncbi:deoxyribose-phosphate aldolase [Flavobacterium sp. ST-75]|uniref:Deoxyribose-phosphate aldolase n=1 Tax=Flavobacterium rhizophilum TaxID=3163296 RepID=A0ABW8YCV0_9FLAO
MDVRQYIDSTYLKTPAMAGVTIKDNNEVVKSLVRDAVINGYKLVMVRPETVTFVKELLSVERSKVLIGTVVDFPEGEGTLFKKLEEARECIEWGADELDFVIDYKAYKRGDIEKVKTDVIECTRLGLDHKKVVKWIIEVAALSDKEIISITVLIKNIVLTYFSEPDYFNVFVKSSTGFYKTEKGLPNGATIHSIKLMLENSFPLPVKAAGGIRNYNEAVQMIRLGVKRIGTSLANQIIAGEQVSGEY